MSATRNDDHPDVIMLPPLILLIALAIAIGMEFTGTLQFLPPMSGASWALYLGVAFLIVALALGVSAIRTFTSVGTNPSPHQPSLKLATSGPYRFTRNPMYLGFVMILAGLSLIFSLDWGIILVPVLLVLLHYGVVTREETYLTAKFGQPYRDFMSRTRRWI